MFNLFLFFIRANVTLSLPSRSDIMRCGLCISEGCQCSLSQNKDSTEFKSMIRDLIKADLRNVCHLSPSSSSFIFYDDKDMGTHITLKSTGRGCPRAQFPSRDRPVSQPALFQTLVGHSVIVVRLCRRWGRECMREEGNRRT